MDLDAYQKMASRTECDQQESRIRIFSPPALPTSPGIGLLTPIRLLHAAIGIAGEAGEINSCVENWLYYGKDLDRGALESELGDLLWYVALACNALGIRLEDVLLHNLAKLAVRYPNGYSSTSADRANRDTEAERRAVSGSQDKKPAAFPEDA